MTSHRDALNWADNVPAADGQKPAEAGKLAEPLRVSEERRASVPPNCHVPCGKSVPTSGLLTRFRVLIKVGVCITSGVLGTAAASARDDDLTIASVPGMTAALAGGSVASGQRLGLIPLGGRPSDHLESLTATRPLAVTPDEVMKRPDRMNDSVTPRKFV